MPKIVGVLPPAVGFTAYCEEAGEVVQLTDRGPCPYCGVLNAHLDQHPNWKGGWLPFGPSKSAQEQLAESRNMKGYASWAPINKKEHHEDA
jgi:hypothetical protein